MVSCRAPRCTNRADKHSNRIALVTMIIMLLQLYLGIFRTLAHLMFEAYSKPFQISKLMRHIAGQGVSKMPHVRQSHAIKHVLYYGVRWSHAQKIYGERVKNIEI